jgi:signal transduction histidine kinase
MILEEVRRLERLVAELGDFTKEYRLLKRKADINAILKDVIKIMAGAYPANKYVFNETFSPDVEEITCDPDRLKQVFINIITNGLEAMANGGSLSIATERFPGHIEVRISDEGIGIPDEDLKHIFEPFYTTRENGAGLGLSISYKIIEAHEGDLTAVSLPYKGTTITVQLPIQ